ncbi:hypothetical protein AB4144_04930 [Rhizobiaceae sp. 2RAB30]|jgi:hypothetical protein
MMPVLLTPAKSRDMLRLSIKSIELNDFKNRSTRGLIFCEALGFREMVATVSQTVRIGCRPTPAGFWMSIPEYAASGEKCAGPGSDFAKRFRYHPAKVY